MKPMGLWNYISTILVFLLAYFIVHFMLYNDKLTQPGDKYNLKRDGFCVLKNVFSPSQIQHLKKECNRDNYKKVKDELITNQKLNSIIKNCTSKDHGFQDYIFIIKKSAVHTCHRDGNGDFFNEGQKFPSYTMILFLEDMEKCLGVVPQSHKSVDAFNFNFTEGVTNVVCEKGDIVLFNANLIHVGALNSRDDNLRVQMKVTHKDDVPVISYYNNYNKILKEDNMIPFYIRRAQQKLSCMFPIFSNWSQSEIRRTSVKGEQTGMFQKMFSYVFYGNSGFYDLPDAF